MMWDTTAPTFIIPKKDESVQFISDFRELNKRIKSILQKEFGKIDKKNSELIYLAGEVINET